MRDAGVEVATTQVGDRYVLEALRERGWALGGEQSGHIIDMGFAPSGDGIASALLTLEALAGGDLAERDAMAQAAAAARQRPRRRPRRRDGRARRSAAASAREGAALEGRGRVLVRPSGTEPLVRVMVEAPTAEEAARSAPASSRSSSASRRPAERRTQPRATRPAASGAEVRAMSCRFVCRCLAEPGWLHRELSRGRRARLRVVLLRDWPCAASSDTSASAPSRSCCSPG